MSSIFLYETPLHAVTESGTLLTIYRVPPGVYLLCFCFGIIFCSVTASGHPAAGTVSSAGTRTFPGFFVFYHFVDYQTYYQYKNYRHSDCSGIQINQKHINHLSNLPHRYFPNINFLPLFLMQLSWFHPCTWLLRRFYDWLQIFRFFIAEFGF